VSTDETGEIEKSRREEQALVSGAKRAAAERKESLKRFSTAALKAKKANDARAFGEQLRLLKIVEGSPEWTKAWKYFYSK
jgi:hypothetical protein